MTDPPPRYCPERSFPPYAYISGRWPHPGHAADGQRAPTDPAKPLEANAAHRFAIDLFNAGYYWESHEEWESLWVTAGRCGPRADFLKALIKLAAAGVKAREGRIGGVRRHARRAAELLRAVQANLAGEQQEFGGMRLEKLIAAARTLEASPPCETAPLREPYPVLGVTLRLER